MSWLQSPHSDIGERCGRYLLVIAHPDDEVMFFSPFLEMAYNTHSEIFILCLSNGNDEGLGSIRTEELIKCATLYNIPKENLSVVNHPELQDGMRNNWPLSTISEFVINYIKSVNPSVVSRTCSVISSLIHFQIVTFDERGVSDHPNHIATYKGVQLAFSKLRSENRQLTALKLLSKSTLRKFLGPFDLFFSMWSSEYVIISCQVIKTLMGMYAHASQNLWYRKIFVVLSSFTYMNTFSTID